MTFTRAQLNEFRDMLIAKRAELDQLRETGEQAADIVELDQTRVGRLSRMDAMQAQAMSRETNRRRDLELQRIESTLRRLADGDFGVCVRCEEPISPLRLRADPTTLLCIDCAA